MAKKNATKAVVDLEHSPRDPENFIRGVIYQPSEARWGLRGVAVTNTTMRVDVPD